MHVCMRSTCISAPARGNNPLTNTDSLSPVSTSTSLHPFINVLSLTLTYTTQISVPVVQEGVTDFCGFFSAACKVSTTCNPDTEGTKHVDSDLTCKGM